MSTKFVFTTQTTIQSMLQNQVMATSALLYISLNLNKKLVAENRKLKLHMPVYEQEIKILNEKIKKVSTRCGSFKSNAIQLAAQLNKSSALNKVMKEKVEATKLELERERAFKAKLSTQSKRLSEVVVDLTSKLKTEDTKFIPDYFGDNEDSTGYISPFTVASRNLQSTKKTATDRDSWQTKQFEVKIENLKQQKMEAVTKLRIAEDKLSQFQNQFFLHTIH